MASSNGAMVSDMIDQPLPGFDVGERVIWEPTRAFAFERLERFLPRAGRAYARRRNYDLGPQDRSNVSALSPLIRYRLILEEEVLRETLRLHSLEEAEKFVQEVVWRAYFKGWLEHRPEVWARYCANRDRWLRVLETDPTLDARFGRAVSGGTGIECLDAWAQELVETGYLHNHARMWFASIWIFTLDLPWELGADFFLRHLLDGDPASNTASWRWVAGLHTPGKTYLARPDNIERFTSGRFSPGDTLAGAAPALWEPALPQPLPLQLPDRLDTTGPFALLVTEEDCVPEKLDLPSTPAAVLGWRCTKARSPLPGGELARDFASGAVDDALARCASTFGLDPDCCMGVDADETIDWLRSRGLTTVVTGHVPVGPVADTLEAHAGAWDAAGIRCVAVRRRYDELLWPHATQGFFALKRKIPDVLAALGLVSGTHS